MNGSINGSLNGPINEPINGSFTAPLNGPLDEPLNGPMNGSIVDPLTGGQLPFSGTITIPRGLPCFTCGPFGCRSDNIGFASSDGAQAMRPH